MKKLFFAILASLTLVSCTKEIKLSDLYKDKNFYTKVTTKKNTDSITSVSLRLNSDNSKKVIMRLFYEFKPDTIKKINFEKTKKSGKLVEDVKVIQGWRMSCYQIGLTPDEYEKTCKPFTLIIDNVKYVFTGKRDESVSMVFYYNEILSDDEVFVDKLRKAKTIFVEYGSTKENLISLKSDAIKLYDKYKKLEGSVFVKDTKIAFDIENDVVEYDNNKISFYNSVLDLSESDIKLLIIKSCDEAKSTCRHPLTFKPKDCMIYDVDGIITVSLTSEASNSFNVPGEFRTYVKFDKSLKMIESNSF